MLQTVHMSACWRVVVVLAAGYLMSATGAAHAQARPQAQAPVAPVAEARVDVDGDGAADVVSIENPPAVSVRFAGKRGAGGAWKPFAASGRTLVAGTITTAAVKALRGRTVIVATGYFADSAGGRRAPIGGGAAGEAMILAWQGGALNKLWEGKVGRHGSDGEYAVRVKALPWGILRYQARPDVQRCDGQEAYLFPQGYDPRRRRFRAIYNPPRIAADAPVLTATRTAPPGGSMTPAVAFRTRAASTQAGAAHAGELVPPRELDDGDPATVWREGTGGNGRGEFITLTTTMDAPVIAAVRIIPGDAASERRFLRGNRLARVGLVIGRGRGQAHRTFWIEFPEDPARGGRFDQPYWIRLPDGVRGRCVTLVIDRVYAGAAARSPRAGDTAIADLAVLTSMDLSDAGPEAVLAARVAGGGAGGDRAARLLVSRGARATAAVLAEIEAGGRTEAERMRLRRVLARLGDPRGAEQVVEGLAGPEVSEADQRLFAAALERMGGQAIPAVAALLAAEDASSASRRAAARVLAVMSEPAAQQALLDAAGAGDRDLRRAVAVALGQRDPAEMAGILAALAEAAEGGEPGREGREADLWRALGLMARRADPAARAAAGQAMAERLPAAAGYELPYRLFAAAGGLEHDPALAALEAALAGEASRGGAARARALRRVAATALAGNPSPRARAMLLGLSADPDPGVRRRAVAGLGQRDDAGPDSDAALIARLEGDAWPRVRRGAASALSRRCSRPGPAAAALHGAVDTDDHIDVRRAALTALVECRAPGIGPRLLEVAADRARPVALRQRALTLVPVLGDRDLAPALIALFSALRKRAWSDEGAVRLAAAAAVAMGRLGAPAVVPPLLTAAREASFPEIQAAAVTGLGEMCPPRALPIFDRLLRSPQRAVAIAARGARNRCH